MDEKNNSIEFKDKILIIYKENKFKLFFLIIVLILSLLSFLIIKNIGDKKNQLISEKYIQAGIFLTLNKNNVSKEILEEIILSKNKFYSVLSLNVILEKNLETDKQKILEYFEIVEDLNLHMDQKDLVLLKKSLYLIDNKDVKKGKRLLKSLADSDSNYKKLAQEILSE